MSTLAWSTAPVDGDPLADIRALRRVRVVVASGKAYDPDKLWRSVGFSP